MIRSGFTHTTNSSRILFGRGRAHEAAAEVERLGVARALVLTTPQQRDSGERIVSQIGELAGGLFAEAAMHTPVEVTDRALDVMRECRADGVMSIGGGSTIGLGKAIAARTEVPQLVIPTTYAGSEVTPILGETQNGRKTTRRGPEILPETVLYDPELSDHLPVGLSCTSGLNAMAHAAEGIYARDGSPLYTVIAVDALRALSDALPAIVADPASAVARDQALYGAWLCGTVLGGVGMSVHHKLCHALGGALDLPHAETHAVLLPYTLAFVEAAVPDALAPAAGLFGDRVGRGLFDFARGLHVPGSLADLGVQERDLRPLAELAAADPYWSPREVDSDGIEAVLHQAWLGIPPE